MTFLEIIFTIIGAIIIGVLFYYVFRVTGPWGSLWTFLLVLILGGLATTAWVTPFGPQYNDVAWLSILLIVIFLALLLAAATPPARTRRGPYRSPEERAAEREDIAESSSAAALGLFFYIFIIFLLVAAIVGIFT